MSKLVRKKRVRSGEELDINRSKILATRVVEDGGNEEADNPFGDGVDYNVEKLISEPELEVWYLDTDKA